MTQSLVRSMSLLASERRVDGASPDVELLPTAPCNELPSESAPEPGDDAFGGIGSARRRFTSALVRGVRLIRYRIAAAQLDRALAARPSDPALLMKLAELHSSFGRTDAAVAGYTRLAAAYRTRRDADGVAYCCRKLALLGFEPVNLLRDLVTLYAVARRDASAVQAARRVVEIYLAEGQHSAAAGFARELQKAGIHDERVRALLGDHPESRGTGSLAGRGSVPEPGHELLSLQGNFGRITPFDAVEICERNSVTGRLEIRTPNYSGTVSFDRGRIVAAATGTLTGAQALESLVLAPHGQFSIFSFDTPDRDEFGATTNTRLLLEVLRGVERRHGTRNLER